MKKLSLLLITLITSMVGASLVSAQSYVNIRIDGETKNCIIEPYVKDGRTLVDLKDISSLLDIEFKYDSEAKLITANTEDYSLELTVDSEEAKGTRLSYTLDVTPQIDKDNIMVPLRFIAEQLGYKVGWEQDTQTVIIEKLHLIRDEADTDAQKWALARARQLTEFKFTPLKDIPTAISSKEHGVFEAGKEYKGFPYSSTEENDKFLCENVTFETYLSALSNPDSVLYTKDMYHSSNASTYYGIVCNSLVRYCFGIKNRCNTQNWLDIPGMNQVAPKKEFTVDDLVLCDVLHAYGEGSNHVAIITGILRDETGEIVKVEVSEAVRTTCRRRLFTVEDFYGRFGERYKLCRYEYLDNIPKFDEEENKILFESGIEKKTPVIAVDYGDKSNYFEGDTTVISTFAEGENIVEILRDGTLIEEIKVNGYEKLERNFEKGYYVVKLANTEHYTEFCVCKPEITHTVKDGFITINASSGDPESKIIFMEFRRPGETYSGLVSMVNLTEEERKTGVIVREIPENAGTYKISFQNKYGIWTHTIIKI